MGRQFICAAGICILLLFCTVAKSQDTLNEIHKKNIQDSTNIFLVKENVDILLTEVEVLNKKSNTQINLLKALEGESKRSDDGVCDSISSFFNSTLRKYKQFEDLVITKLDEIHGDQTTILVKQNLSGKNCPQSSALDVLSEAISEMSGKIDNLETQLKSFQTSNDEQMKILKEINAKLLQHHDKFENFEKELPKLVQPKDGEKSPQTKQTVPINLILGMTQQRMTTKT